MPGLLFFIREEGLESSVMYQSHMELFKVKGLDTYYMLDTNSLYGLY